MQRTLVVVLMVLLGLAVGMHSVSVVAQTKKDDKVTKKDDKAGKKKDDKKEAKAGVIEINKGKDDKYRFFVRDGDDKLLAMSGPGGFATFKDAEDAVNNLRQVIAKAKVQAGDKGK